MKFHKIFLITLFTGIFLSQMTIFAEEALLTGLKKTHPLLLIQDHSWNKIKVDRKTNPMLDKILNRTEQESKYILTQKILVYEMKGKRLLTVSRNAIKRIIYLIVSYKTTEDPTTAIKYKQRAEDELLSIAQFPNWNPSHFLDVAEMTTAAAIGYDWLYEDLSEPIRKILKNAILEKAIKLGNDPFLPNTSWYQKEMNWNQVCFSGLALGALAIANEEPIESEKMLNQVYKNIKFGLIPYAPEGIYPEGPSYWSYGTTYQILLNESLKSALGTDWNLWNSKGFKLTAEYLLQITGPTLKYFNYSDGDEDPDIEPALYKMATELNNPDLLFFQNQLLDDALKNPKSWLSRFFPLLVIWSSDFQLKSEPKLDKNWIGNGQQPLAIFRSSWQSNALYLAIKGGSASLSHAHMDTGSFVLDRDGVRWAVDLGSQDYFSLESKNVDLWSRVQNSQRWDVFRINPLSHNTLSIGETHHHVQGAGKIIKFKLNAANPYVVLDLSTVFSEKTSEVKRRFSINNKKEVLISDLITGLKKNENIHWNWTTRASATLKKRNVTLSDSGQQLRLKLIEPKDAKWKVSKADPPPNDFDSKNPGVSLITIDYKSKGYSKTSIKVLIY